MSPEERANAIIIPFSKEKKPDVSALLGNVTKTLRQAVKEARKEERLKCWAEALEATSWQSYPEFVRWLHEQENKARNG